MMKSMKKMISLLLVLLFAVSAFTTGCDSKPSNLTPNESTSSIPTTTTTNQMTTCATWAAQLPVRRSRRWRGS